MLSLFGVVGATFNDMLSCDLSQPGRLQVIVISEKSMRMLKFVLRGPRSTVVLVLFVLLLKVTFEKKLMK